MIVGIDHIAFSVSDIEEALPLVASWGYRSVFVEKGVLNHVAKTPFLRKREEKHNIAYCESLRGGVAIELTVHGDVRVAPVGRSRRPHVRRTAEGNLPATGPAPLIKVSPYQVYFSQTFPRVIDVVSLETSDVERSAGFWSKLGFKEKSPAGARTLRRQGAGMTSELSFTTPLASQKLTLRLIHSPKKSKRLYYIDDRGFPCIAFLTTHIERDRLLLGDTASDIFSMTIHQQLLDICLGRGPDGECVELIAIRKRL